LDSLKLINNINYYVDPVNLQRGDWWRGDRRRGDRRWGYWRRSDRQWDRLGDRLLL